MNRQLSSFDIYVITKELRELQDSYIDKIYQLSRNEILIRFRNIKNKKRENIFIRNGELICITNKDLETPDRPSVFATTLRKYLKNGKIADVQQHEFDRILKIMVSKKEGVYTLIIEFFSDGNIILVDPDGKIILPFIRQVWAHRKLKGREPYNPPPSQVNPFDLSLDKFKELIKKSDKDLVRTLAVNVNLSGFIAEEICKRAKIDKNTEIKNINDEQINIVFKSLKNFLKIFKKREFKPVIVKENNKTIDVLPFVFEIYKDYDFEEIDSYIRGFEKFIGKTKKPKKQKERKNKKEELLGKLNRQKIQQEKAIKRIGKEITEKKNEGDLIYLHYQEIEKNLNDIKEILDLKEKKESIEKINKKDIVKEFNPEKNTLILKLNDTKNKFFDVKIDFRKTVSENAERAYDENKKLKSKLNGAKKALDKTQDEIKKFKKQIKREEKQKKESEEKTKKKKEKTFWFERYRWFISSNGNIVVAGKDAKTNDTVVKKYLSKGDRYSHADISGAPSVIIKSKDIHEKKVLIDKKTLEEACIFAASYSKAWKQFAEAEAYWVLPEQVSKTPQSGEFLPKGAFIIRGKRNYHRCKLEVAVGEIEIEGCKKIMGGPVDSVKDKSDKYVILNPGPEKKNDISKKLAKTFGESIETISKVLPPGGASIADGFGVEV